MSVIDNRTTNYNIKLPHGDNALEDDVTRIREGFITVDTVLADKLSKSEGGTITGNIAIDVQKLKITSNVNGYNDCVKNGLYRGKFLGNSLTSAQSAAIQAGTFDDLYIGDYWTINGVNYRIAAFDYYYQCGDGYNANTNPTGSTVTTHHVVVVPDRHMYSISMNDEDTTEGGYVGSKMYAENLNDAKTAITEAFGAGHLLSVRQYFSNAVNASKGWVNAGAWYDATVWLMNEINVYGCRIYGNVANGENVPNLYTVDNRQYPLFRFWGVHRNGGNSRFGFWLRDPVNQTSFALVSSFGGATNHRASVVFGVRPAFCVK